MLIYMTDILEEPKIESRRGGRAPDILKYGELADLIREYTIPDYNALNTKMRDYLSFRIRLNFGQDVVKEVDSNQIKSVETFLKVGPQFYYHVLKFIEGGVLNIQETILDKNDFKKAKTLYSQLARERDTLIKARLLADIQPIVNKLVDDYIVYVQKTRNTYLGAPNPYQPINTTYTMADIISIQDPNLRQQKLKEYEQTKVMLDQQMVSMDDVEKLQQLEEWENNGGLLTIEVYEAALKLKDPDFEINEENKDYYKRLVSDLNKSRRDKWLLDYEAKKLGAAGPVLNKSLPSSVMNAFNQTYSNLNNNTFTQKVEEKKNYNAKSPLTQMTYTYPYGIPSAEIKIESGKFVVHQNGKKTPFSNLMKARTFALSGGHYDKKLKELNSNRELLSTDPPRIVKLNPRIKF